MQHCTVAGHCRRQLAPMARGLWAVGAISVSGGLCCAKSCGTSRESEPNERATPIKELWLGGIGEVGGIRLALGVVLRRRGRPIADPPPIPRQAPPIPSA